MLTRPRSASRSWRARWSASAGRSSGWTSRASSCSDSSSSGGRRELRSHPVTNGTEASAAEPAALGSGAARVGAGIFLSRVFGFVRERFFAYYFGSSDFADAWRAALRLPNVVQNLLGEGTLSASLIPVYSELIEKGELEKAGRFAGAALGLLAAVAAGVALAGTALAPVLVAIFFASWDPAKQALTVDLVRILFPMTGVLVLSAWALGILNSHRRFFVSYVAPVFWNLAMIAAMVAGAAYFGSDAPSRDLVVALAWGALVGGLIQFAWQLPFVMGHVRGLRLSFGRGVEGVREAVHNFWPVVAARGIVNVSAWIDLFLAGWLRSGAVAVLGYAQTFYMLPISLFGMSIAASELPELSRMRGEAERIVAERVGKALRRIAYFMVPSALAYVVLGDVIVAALYQTGEFDASATLVTWTVLGAYALGLPASGASRVMSSAFYALRDSRTPSRVAYVRVTVSLVVGLALMIPLDRIGVGGLALGAAGLALGATSGAWVEYGLLRRALGARIGRHGPEGAASERIWLAAAAASAAGVLVQIVLPPAHPAIVALETLVPFGVVYIAGAALLGERFAWRPSKGA
ncbi:MAG: murein biosynthesis integral membrane protein MurJ [Gemmatimonadetes bacterium]|nr:murein biosynthesis integral membrane protein MurJ [Gemmatimonadota bacterium]